MKIDDIHFNLRKIDSYNKAFNLVISEREAGKSTAWILKAYKAFKEGYTSLIVRRQVVDITEVYIQSIEEVINKFTDDKVKLVYKTTSLKEGVVNITINDKLFACIVGLSIKIARIKSLVIPRIKYGFFDEFIVNSRFGEKYLQDEATKFKELYNTFQREADGLFKFYFFGNPYSLYNPYFMWLNIEPSTIKRGKTIIGENFVLNCYEIKQELRDYILRHNPLYVFDDAYTRYAFGGEAVNDENIKVSVKPNNFYLRFIFKVAGKYIGVYQNNYYGDDQDRFYCGFIESFSERRSAICFDFEELVARCEIISNEDKVRYTLFKSAMRSRLVAFSSINCYYLIKEVYENI